MDASSAACSAVHQVLLYHNGVRGKRLLQLGNWQAYTYFHVPYTSTLMQATAGSSMHGQYMTDVTTEEQEPTPSAPDVLLVHAAL